MLNGLDWIIIAIIGMSSLLSLKRGFLKEALSLVSWSVALFVAISFRSQLALLLEGVIALEPLRELAAFLLLFVVTLFVGCLMGFTLNQLFKVTGLKITDRLIGVFFGVTRGALIVLVGVVLIPGIASSAKDSGAWQGSVLMPYITIVEDWVYKSVPDFERFQAILS